MCRFRFPVVGMGVLVWVECVVTEPSYFKLCTEHCPVHLALLDEVASCHHLLHHRLLRLLVQLFESPQDELEILVQVRIQTKFIHIKYFVLTDWSTQPINRFDSGSALVTPLLLRVYIGGGNHHQVICLLVSHLSKKKYSGCFLFKTHFILTPCVMDNKITVGLGVGGSCWSQWLGNRRQGNSEFYWSVLSSCGLIQTFDETNIINKIPIKSSKKHFLDHLVYYKVDVMYLICRYTFI